MMLLGMKGSNTANSVVHNKKITTMDLNYSQNCFIKIRKSFSPENSFYLTVLSPKNVKVITACKKSPKNRHWNKNSSKLLKNASRTTQGSGGEKDGSWRYRNPELPVAISSIFLLDFLKNSTTSISDQIKPQHLLYLSDTSKCDLQFMPFSIPSPSLFT